MGHAQLQETSGCTHGLVKLRLKMATRVAAPQGLLWASAVGGVAFRLASRAARSQPLSRSQTPSSVHASTVWLPHAVTA